MVRKPLTIMISAVFIGLMMSSCAAKGVLGETGNVSPIPISTSGAETPAVDSAKTADAAENKETQPSKTKNEPVYLDVLKNSYSNNETAISYTIVNNSGKPVSVVLAPKLERMVEDSWEYVPSDIGFCGNPDRIEDTYTGEVPLEWYGNKLTAGQYRLSLNMVKSDMNFDIKAVLYDTFTVEEK